MIGGRVLDATAISDIAIGRTIYGAAFLAAANDLGIALAVPAAALQDAWAAAAEEDYPFLELLTGLPLAVVVPAVSWWQRVVTAGERDDVVLPDPSRRPRPRPRRARRMPPSTWSALVLVAERRLGSPETHVRRGPRSGGRAHTAPPPTIPAAMSGCAAVAHQPHPMPLG